ncbi:MAG: hypothetical protein J6X41_00745 [Spirochaetales bacterium]|nr:hypothetical protein [Spirochaetales bacterium]
MRSKFFQKLFYNWQAKIISFLLAVFVYFILMFSIQNSRTIALPVEVVMPEGYVATSNVPSSIDLVIQGTEDQIYLIDVSKIMLKVDFSMVDREGISYATVQIDINELASYIDTSAVSIYTKPSQVRVYFSAAGGAK